MGMTGRDIELLVVFELLEILGVFHFEDGIAHPQRHFQTFPREVSEIEASVRQFRCKYF